MKVGNLAEARKKLLGPYREQEGPAAVLKDTVLFCVLT